MKTTVQYYIRFANGGELSAGTFAGAVKIATAGKPQAVVGDLEPHECGNAAIRVRALVWVSESDSRNDDGSRAIAEILEVHGAERAV